MIRWVWATFIFHPIYKGQFGSLVGQLILQAGTIADMASMGSMLPGWSWNSTPSSPSLSFLQETTEPLFAADSNDGIRGHMGKTCVFFSCILLVVLGRTPNKFAASRPSFKGHGMNLQLPSQQVHLKYSEIKIIRIKW